MVNELDYNKLKESGLVYGFHNRLCLWVHPLMSPRDLGQEIVDFFRSRLEEFAKDPNYVMILTQGEMDAPQRESEQRWRERIYPIIGDLPQMFSERYLKWPHGNFVETNNPEHIETIRSSFKVKPVHYRDSRGPKNRLFLTADLDGLKRDTCLEWQMGDLNGLSLRSPEYWPGTEKLSLYSIMQLMVQ